MRVKGCLSIRDPMLRACRRLRWPVFLLALFTCLFPPRVYADGTDPYYSIPRTDEEYQQRLERLASFPPRRSVLEVRSEGFIPSYPDVGLVDKGQPSGVLYATFGQPLRTAVGRLFHLTIEIRREGMTKSMYVHAAPLRPGRTTFERKSIPPGRIVEPLRLSPFVADLRPGNYELRAISIFGPGYPSGGTTFSPKEMRPLRIQVNEGQATYLGRLSLVPLPAHRVNRQGRTGSQHDAQFAEPELEQVLGGFVIWVQRNAKEDLLLAGLLPDTTTIDLSHEVTSLVPGLTTDTVTDEELDHRLAWERWLATQPTTGK